MDQQFFGYGGIIIAVFILLFAFSTILGNYFYAQSNLSFIVDNKKVTFAFRVIVVIMTAVGAVLGVQLVWTLADLFMAFLAIINLMMVVALSPLVFELMRDYKSKKTEENLRYSMRRIFLTNCRMITSGAMRITVRTTLKIIISK